MYNLTQFVPRSSISLSLVFFTLYIFIVHLHLQIFLYFLRAYIFIVQFYHSPDNDQSMVETSCFTIDFYSSKL